MHGIAAYAEAELSVLYWYLSVWFALLSAEWGYWKNQWEMPEAWDSGPARRSIARYRTRTPTALLAGERLHHPLCAKVHGHVATAERAVPGAQCADELADGSAPAIRCPKKREKKVSLGWGRRVV